MKKTKTKTQKWTYYYIECMDLLGRGPDEDYYYYTYEKGEWRQDVMRYIQDHLIGYDYDRIGDPEMMREIEKISKKEAMAIMARQDKEGRRYRR